MSIPTTQPQLSLFPLRYFLYWFCIQKDTMMFFLRCWKGRGIQWLSQFNIGTLPKLPFAIVLLSFPNLPRPDEYNRYEAKLHELQQSLTGVYRCLWKLGKTTYSLIHELSRYFGSNQPQEDVVCESSFRLWPPQGAFHKRIHWWNWQSSI